MTITRARAITKKFFNGLVATMRPEEAADYKSITDDAIVWAMEHEPRRFYDLVLRYLHYLENPDHHVCSTCEYWEPFTGACCSADSPYCADFTDGDCTCDSWKERLEK